MTQVIVPSHLFSYTGGETHIECQGATLGEVLNDLEKKYKGIRFRIIDEQDQIRTHINIFVGRKYAKDLQAPVTSQEEVMIVAALSGG